jgi:acyl dehydratase
MKPVFVGDTNRVEVTIRDKRAHKMPAHGIVSELLEVAKQRLETVLVCEHLLLVKMKGA